MPTFYYCLTSHAGSEQQIYYNGPHKTDSAAQKHAKNFKGTLESQKKLVSQIDVIQFRAKYNPGANLKTVEMALPKYDKLVRMATEGSSFHFVSRKEYPIQPVEDDSAQLSPVQPHSELVNSYQQIKQSLPILDSAIRSAASDHQVSNGHDHLDHKQGKKRRREPEPSQILCDEEYESSSSQHQISNGHHLAPKSVKKPRQEPQSPQLANGEQASSNHDSLAISPHST